MLFQHLFHYRNTFLKNLCCILITFELYLHLSHYHKADPVHSCSPELIHFVANFLKILVNHQPIFTGHQGYSLEPI